jgi:DNA-binding CsgD family transcriptional regulator
LGVLPFRTVAIAAIGKKRNKSRMDTSDGIKRLTDRQKEILRLLFNGHDAKSAAAELGISIHTVNDHLGEARKHLGVSSSRLAARLFAQSEGSIPKNEGPDRLGVAGSNDDSPSFASAIAKKRLVFAGGLAVVLFSIAVMALLFGNAGQSAEDAMTSPRVVSTNPADGSTISPGTFNLTVRFDRPMLEGNFSFVQISPDTFPDCRSNAQLSTDGKSYTMRCTATAERDYEIWFNRPPYMNFKSQAGIAARPHRIRFTTKPR